MKQSHLEIRPLYLRREDRTRAHVFVTMLAYMIERKLSEYWKEVELTVKEGLDALTTVITGTIEIANVNHYRLKPVASITLAKQINEMKSQNYLVCDAFLVLQYIFVLVAHLDFPLSQQNNL
jgi:transposase